MIKADYHMHTTYSDGSGSPEDMVLKAISLGLSEVGISDHSFTSFDTACCIQQEKMDEYYAEISALREKYKGQIKVLCGIEQDYYSDFPAEGFDYIIGSVHYLKFDDEYVTVDYTPDILITAAEKYFGGDIYCLCEEYFKTVSDVVQKTGADIIGHFDLISKLNEKYNLFDEENPRYINAWKAAADKLILTGKPFEINTGAISRSYKTEPYPSLEQTEYIKAKGGSFILSSDAHSPENICFFFDKYCDKFNL